MTTRSVVVTGGSRGIGRACALDMAERGCQVTAIGRDRDALDEVAKMAAQLGATVTPRVCELTDEEAVKEVFAAIGAVDIVVHAAGVSMSAPVARVRQAEALTAFNANAMSALFCAQQAIGGMRARGWGRFVFIGSTCGLVGMPYTTAYTMSKHALLGLMRVIAAEVAGTAVTSNAVCPTYVATEMTENSAAAIAEATKSTTADVVATMAASAPLGRLVETDEVAAAVAYLCSEAAGALNGQAIVLDGGGVQR